MGLAFRAFFIALFAVMKRWKIVFFFFLLNFLFSAFLASPLFEALSAKLGHYSDLRGLFKEFMPEVIVDFAHGNQQAMRGFFLTAGLGGLVYFLMYHVFSGGMIAILADPREKTTMKTFLKLSGRYSFRFVRLLFYFLIFLGLLFIVNRSLDKCLLWYLNDVKDYGANSQLLGWTLFAKNLVMLLLLAYTLVSFNYAKTVLVIEGRHFTGACLLSGMAFALIHPLATGLFFLCSSLVLVGVTYAYILFSRLIDTGESYLLLKSIGGISLSGTLLYLLVAQGIQFLIQACLVLRHAGQVYLYKYLTVQPSHVDPELANPDPYSPFIPDRPYTGPDEPETHPDLEGQSNA
jgi:hypothetical protein